MKAAIRVSLLLAGTALVHAAPPRPLEESLVIEAIGDVRRVPDTGPHVAAAKGMNLRFPDRVETGRPARAELEAPDGTITRLGAMTTFAIDRASRSMKLERGSVLFHSPSGQGGGKIVSPSASASVLGTTIIAAATPEGGFKLLVLEGRAQVDFAAGTRLRLEAGQMTFVLPAGGGVGSPGPVLNFDLAQQIKASQLVHGFSRPLPSQGKIEQAVAGQRRLVGSGQFITTGFLVYTATSDTQVNGIEASGPDADNNLTGEFTAPQRLALNTNVTLTGARLPAERSFRTPLLVPESESLFLKTQSDVLVTGLLGLNLTVATPTLSLADWGLPAFQLVAKQAITFTGSTRFTDLAGIDYLRIFSPQINVATGAILETGFSPPTRAATFYFDTDRDLALSGGSVINRNGGLILQVHSGDLRIANETLQADGPIGAELVVPSALNLDVRTGALDLSGSTVRTTGGGFAAYAKTVAVTRTRLDLGGNFWTHATDSVRLDTLTLGPPPAAAVFQATANNLVSLRAVALDGFREVNLGARTLALEGVSFAAGSTVRLVSEQGRLAPLPNTGQTVQPGLVNFVRDVTYAGRPAQDYVAASTGGTGLQLPAIVISKPTPLP